MTSTRKPGAKWLACAALTMATTIAAPTARADQGGIGYWLPGSFASLAATPLTPGWSWAFVYLHSSVSAGGAVSASRTIGFPNRSANLNINLRADLDGKADLGVFSPTYVFETPVLGGQFAVTVLGIYGRQEATIDAKLNGNLGPIGFAAERSVNQSMWGFGDVFVQPTLRWNQGVHNYMVYAMTSAPVGAYDSSRLVNLGLGHTAIDAGGGYTYFNPETGNEFSFVTGLTYNFENPDLDYKNGIDWHLDWGASHFFSKQLYAGVAGYAYQQITGDSGPGATLGDFKSRVFGIGPQFGYLFPAGDMQGLFSVRGYWEFGAENRAEGWNVWSKLAFSPVAHPAAAKSALK
jgi:hypothetical protein